MSDELPQGWIETPLADVCEPVSQRGPSRERETFRYVDLGALDNKAKRITQAGALPVSGAPSRAKQVIAKGDVLFSTVRVYLENIAQVPEVLDGEIASTAFCVLRPREGLDPNYLYYFVTSRHFIQAVNELQRGNSPPSVQDGDVRGQRIPLAPPREQQRIASRIEELFSDIEAGEHALERVQKLVERYRQSVLKAAVTGELTREWREKHKGPLESGEALLQRILKARREAWEKAELARLEANGQGPVNTDWKQRYQELADLPAGELQTLPDGWVWASVEQICLTFGNGLSRKPAHQPPGLPILRISALRPLTVNHDDVRYYVPEAGESVGSFLVEWGDLLFTRYNGSRELVGASGMFAGTEPVLHPDKLIKARVVSPDLVDPRYLAIALNCGES
jgi:type I restriction enzyme, S subunit